jgi:hypothetical protein
VNGDAITTGTRNPSSVLPPTRSGSTTFGAAAHGDAMWLWSAVATAALSSGCGETVVASRAMVWTIPALLGAIPSHDAEEKLVPPPRGTESKSGIGSGTTMRERKFYIRADRFPKAGLAARYDGK